MTDASPLRRLISTVAAETGCGMKDLTVLAPQNDPFRIDTPARHRDGAWLAMTAADLGLGDRPIHLRGLHYMVIGQPKPDGTPYINTDADWVWLSQVAGKAARWLGYLPFEQIVDQRNAAPTVQIFTPPEPTPYISVGVEVDIPDADDIVPQVGIDGFDGTQPYKLVLIGEKSSLHEVLAPIAQTYRADLYLPTGEPSDTMLHQMARVGAEDGRPMRVLYFSDCDPAGWQMPLSVSRKLQGLQTLQFPHLEFQVHRVTLTPDQVREYGLPSTPLKETEKRADRWRAGTEVEQTEIDALAALRPDLLRQIAVDALGPFFDHTLDARVFSARSAWLDVAQAMLDEQLDGAQIHALRAEAEAKLATLRREIDAINAALRLDADDYFVPEPEVPQPRLGGAYPLPLLDSRWPFEQQCRRLIESKAYEQGRAVA